METEEFEGKRRLNEYQPKKKKQLSADRFDRQAQKATQKAAKLAKTRAQELDEESIEDEIESFMRRKSK